VLILTGLIILFIVLRRQRNKKLEKRPANEATEVTEAREEENLISNPTYSNNDKDAVGTKPGVDTLHYPRDSIELTEMLENGMYDVPPNFFFGGGGFHGPIHFQLLFDFVMKLPIYIVIVVSNENTFSGSDNVKVSWRSMSLPIKWIM
jgi:hypothetical protein